MVKHTPKKSQKAYRKGAGGGGVNPYSQPNLTELNFLLCLGQTGLAATVLA